MKPDPAINPSHYRDHPSGIEAIEVCGELDFCLGNAFKYLFRCDKKNGIQDIKKALWYLEREYNSRVKKERSRWCRLRNWFSSSDETACHDGSSAIKAILIYEHRYSGHLANAFDCIYCAGHFDGSSEILKRAIQSAENVLSIEMWRDKGVRNKLNNSI